jgi:hypothetical protein
MDISVFLRKYRTTTAPLTTKTKTYRSKNKYTDYWLGDLKNENTTTTPTTCAGFT